MKVIMNVIDQAVHTVAPLLRCGYRVTEQQTSEAHFGNGFVILTRDDVRVRVVNERGQWFVEIGSSSAPEEWFDARLVLSEIGVSAPQGTSESTLTNSVLVYRSMQRSGRCYSLARRSIPPGRRSERASSLRRENVLVYRSKTSPNERSVGEGSNPRRVCCRLNWKRSSLMHFDV